MGGATGEEKDMGAGPWGRAWVGPWPGRPFCSLGRLSLPWPIIPTARVCTKQLDDKGVFLPSSKFYIFRHGIWQQTHGDCYHKR